MYHYILCGLKVESDLAFPELTPWEGPKNQPFDIEFRLGRVQRHWDPNERGLKFHADGPDKIIFQIEHAGRILVENGSRVVFDPFGSADEDRVRVTYIGTTQSMLWYQRGKLPLHASALLVDGRAIAIGAHSHSGKSVIAAALVKRGYPLIADDMMVLDQTTQPPLVLPGYQKLRLWQDACEELGFVRETIANAHFVPGKFVLRTNASSPHAPVPLTDIFILSGLRQDRFVAQPLGRIEAVQYLLGATHMFDAARALARQEQVFSTINAVAANVRVWRATAAEGLAHAFEAADSVLELASSGAPQ